MPSMVVQEFPVSDLTKSRSSDLFALALAIAFPSVATWLYFIRFSQAEYMATLYSVSKVIQFSFPILWVWLVSREARGKGILPIHFPPEAASQCQAVPPAQARWIPGILFGLATGAAIFLIYATLLRNSPVFDEFPSRLLDKLNGMHAGTPTRFLVLGAFISLIHSFLEEYYWRWFVFGKLSNLASSWIAIIVSSLAFAAHHVLVLAAYIPLVHWPVIALFSLGVAVGGAFWAWDYRRSGSLTDPWLSHALVDAALMIVGYDMLWPFLPA